MEYLQIVKKSKQAVSVKMINYPEKGKYEIVDYPWKEFNELFEIRKEYPLRAYYKKDIVERFEEADHLVMLMIFSFLKCKASKGDPSKWVPETFALKAELEQLSETLKVSELEALRFFKNSLRLFVKSSLKAGIVFIDDSFLDDEDKLKNKENRER